MNKDHPYITYASYTGLDGKRYVSQLIGSCTNIYGAKRIGQHFWCKVGETDPFDSRGLKTPEHLKLEVTIKNGDKVWKWKPGELFSAEGSLVKSDLDKK